MSTSSPSISGVDVTPSLTFLTTGCNRDPNALTWNTKRTVQHPQGIIAYAAAELIAIYDPERQILLATLRGHTKKVNAVVWLQSTENSGNGSQSAADDSLELVSAGVDKQIIVWKYNPHTRDYNIQARLNGHEDGISAIAALTINGRTPNESYSIIASTAADLTVRIWLRSLTPSPLTADEPAPPAEAGGWQCIQVLSNGRHKIMHCIDLAAVPIPATETSDATTFLALSVGGVDSKIHLWLSDGSSVASIEFARGVSLAGHENWIRSLQWTQMDRETEVMAVGSSGREKESLSAPLVSMLLASASQDKYVRVWKMQVGRADPSDGAASSASSSSSNTIACTSLGSRGHILTYRGFSLLLVLESVLSGHDNWVMHARWQPALYEEKDGVVTRHQPLCLLSASTDKSMCIWRPTSSGGIWHSDVKVGEMGGHTLGFYGCAFAPDGKSILANGYSGSFHLWRAGAGGLWSPSVTISGHAASVNDLCWDARGDYLLSTGQDQTTRLWAPWLEHKVDMMVLPSASSAAASSSTSASATTNPVAVSLPTKSRSTWHELSRPQLHGYDLNCLCPLYDPEGVRAHSLASGADEKVVRVFWAPQPFLETIRRIAGIETVETSGSGATERPLLAPVMDESRGAGFGEDDEDGEGGGGGMGMKLPTPSPSPPPTGTVPKGASAEQLAFLESTSSRAIKANLPELGLSNKALMDGDASNNMRGMSHVKQVMSSESAAALSVSQPPPEDYLLSTTLWPEVEKLYGHGYEIISIACDYRGTMLASACVAKKAQHAVVRVWQTSDWSEVLQLEAHRSSVVSLNFSPDGRYLMSTSKDRHVGIFELSPGTKETKPTLLGSTKQRAHARIVWNGAWAPTRGTNYFATASRDKTVKCWRVTGEVGKPMIHEDATLPTFSCAATCVSFAPLAARMSSSDDLFPSVDLSRPTRFTLAVGLEDGRIELWRSNLTEKIQSEKLTWTRLYAFPENSCHGGFVKRLAWRWRSSPNETTSELELASCSEDQSVRIFAVPAALLAQP